jgi:excisionase family DNA binding protein
MSQKAAAKPQHDFSQWPTKQQAADILQISTKSVETLANEGKLQSIRWRRPTGGPKIAVYHPVDVETQRIERFPDSASSFVMPAPAPIKPVGIIRPEQAGVEENRIDASTDGARILRLLEGLVGASLASSQKLLPASQKSEKPQVPIEHRVYLTVREAAAYVGRPERQVRQRIAAGALPADKEGHTRVKRADLEKW